MTLALLLACVRPTPTSSAPPPPWQDPAARAFALRAWRAEFRGDRTEAERAWRWVTRLDPSATTWSHRGRALSRMGLDGRGPFRDGLAEDPLDPRLRLGLALAERAPLGELLDAYPCRIAMADHPQRQEAERRCVRSR